MRTTIGYNISGSQNGAPQVYKGRGTIPQVSGSQVMKHGKLTLTVTIPEEIMLTRDTQVSLRFEPLTPGLPEQTATGSVMDYLTLGTARFIVTEVAHDISRISLALIAGNLQASIERQLETPSYLVLSDFADPMRTVFRAPQPLHGGAVHTLHTACLLAGVPLRSRLADCARVATSF